MPADTAVGGLTHFVVYASSVLYEQTTPEALAIVDAAVSASAIEFPDKDLDAGELGGTIAWSPPSDASQVGHYNVISHL